MLVLQLLLIRAFAEEAVVFSLEFGELRAGSDMEVTCSVNNAPHIGGFVMKISFDNDIFKYVDGSYTAKQSKLKDAEANYNATTGLITVLWETGANNGLTTGGKLFSFKLKAASALDSAEHEIGLKVTECYTDEAVPKNIRISAKGGKVSQTVAQKSQQLIDSINAIAPVVYSDECLDKIVKCEQLYKELSASERKQVSNYQDLLNYRAEYNKLAKQALENSEKAAAQAYREKYAGILGKTIDTLTADDKAAVDEALAAWEALPTNAQKALLINEKNQLNKFKTRVDEIAKAAEDEAKRAEEEKALREEAMGYKRDFDAKWEQILKLTTETVTFDYAEVLSIANAEANTYCKMNSYCNEYLKEEMDLISSLIDVIGGDDGGDESGISLSTFLKNYGYLSALKAEDVTSGDAQDIRLAYQFLQMLSPDALSKVEKLAAHIETLMGVVENLDTDGSDDDDGESFADRLPETTIEQISETVYVPGSSTYNIQTKDGEMLYASSDIQGMDSLKGLAVLTLISVAVFGATLAAYLILVKKRSKEVSL